jgi:hypothetical protein
MLARRYDTSSTNLYSSRHPCEAASGQLSRQAADAFLMPSKTRGPLSTG